MKLPFLLAACGCLSFVSCVQSATLPGSSLGKYSVVGTLLTNTCGSGVAAKNPWDFSAELSKDGTTLYLKNEDSSEQVSGGFSSSAESSATLVDSETQTVTSATDVTGTTCNLTLAISYAVTLSSESPPPTFTGSASYSYSVATAIASNTDCSAQLASAGGKYTTLPCTVTYALKATHQ